MKAFSRIALLIISTVLFSVTGLMAQRVIEGTVYMNGEPAAGVTVEVHRSSTSAFTGFDGKYKVDADEKSKWIRFTAGDGTTKRLDLDENSGNTIDFPLTGELPGEETGGTDVILKTHDELIDTRDRDYMNLYSLYNTDMDNNQMENALKNLKPIFNKYPKSHINHYIRGERILESLIEAAETDEEKDKLLDELMKMHDKRIEYFGERSYVLARKADALLEYKIAKRKNQLDDQGRIEVMKKAYDWINSSISELGSKSTVSTVTLFMNTTTSLFKLGELTKETVVKNYDTSSKILNDIVNNSENPEDAKTAKEVAIPYIEQQFSESGAADCEALVNIYTPQYEENIDDAEYIKSMIAKLRRADCDNIELLDRATVRLYELDPSAEAAFNLAHNYLIKDDIDNAKKYYRLAIEQETDDNLLATYYLEYASVIYSKDRNYPEARENARKAVSLNPTLCRAYILIGDIYVAASSSFSDDNFERSTVFWVAVDYYNKARASEECSGDAAEKIAEYSKHFPNKEDGFMDGIQDGDTYKIEGWINETTKARF
ncbi:MAG: hypothetical protein JXR61_05105 [Prolixibacteraceae bacterium]|nr:hypothetical protein [Prolixibacteraceae bacterium]